MLWKILIPIILTSILLILVFFAWRSFLFPAKTHLSPQSPQASAVYPSPYLPTLSLDSIFSPNHSSISQIPEDKKITIIATGDIIPARSVNYQATSRNDFTWSFKEISDFLKSADLTFINLETPLLKTCPVTQEGMIFCGDARHIMGLTLSGVDVASLGNNHAGNHGVSGVQETVQLLESHGILVTGVDDETHSMVIKEIKGIKVAFLGFNDITTPQPGVLNADLDRIKNLIQEAKTKADVVIVTYHWGMEYRSQPDDGQKLLGHYTIDSGADLVIGNHPHWIQPIELYRGKLITYAHGNTIFDQMWSEETKKGVIGKYTFYGKDLIDVEYFPLYIEHFGQPKFATDPMRAQILENLKNQSLILTNPN
jgi:poly-gamma-glutamate capsule biosynthesis protein CapA/YwtB (metallophosphatase superfamily)